MLTNLEYRATPESFLGSLACDATASAAFLTAEAIAMEG